MIMRSDCQIGMHVKFGRPNGEHTLAVIVKLNPLRAKVKTLESRGSACPAGVLWNVPYSAMYYAESQDAPKFKAISVLADFEDWVEQTKLKYGRPEADILSVIRECLK